MALAHTASPTTPPSAAARVAALADALEARARAHAPLLELHRAHLDARGPGRARTCPEHLLDLLDIGLRWRAAVPPARRARALEAGGEELARLAAQLSLVGCPEPALSRLRARRDFALAEDVREVVAVADGLCAWLEDAARVLGPELSAPTEALELLRAEVLGRALRLRPPVFGARARPAVVPIPGGDEPPHPAVPPATIGMARAAPRR